MEREMGDPRSCLLLCSVLMDMEEEENPSSSEEEQEEEEDVALDLDMEQVSGRNLATYSAHTNPHPPPPQGNPQLVHASEPCSWKVSTPRMTLS